MGENISVGYFIILVVCFGSLLTWFFARLKKKIFSSIISVLTISILCGAIGYSVFAPWLFPPPLTEVTVSALGEKNEKSEGLEVILTSVLVDGKEVSLRKIFPTGWINQNGSLVWRDYDQPADLSQTLTGKISLASDYQFVFSQNKWRGMASVQVGEQKEIIDLFTPTEADDNYSVSFQTDFQSVNGDLQKIQTGLITAVSALFILSVLCVGYYKKYPVTTLSSKTGTTHKPRVIWADCLRIVAAFTVVLLHSTVNVFSSLSVTDSAWYPSLYINTFTIFAVPCFFLLSGAFLIHKEETIKRTLSHRVIPLMIPLIFWSVFYIFVRYFTNFYPLKNNIWVSFLAIFQEEQFWHLWFFYALLSIYFLLPFISRCYNRLSISLKWYGVFILLLIPAGINTFLSLFSLNLNNNYLVIFPYLGLFVFGGLLMEYQTWWIGKWKLVLSCIVISYMLTTFLTYYFSMRLGYPTKTGFSGQSLQTNLFAISVFLLFLSLSDVLQKYLQKYSHYISQLSELTFGIFLVHYLFLYGVGNIQLVVWFTQNSLSLWNMMLGASLYFVLSAGLTYMISKIPYLRRVL